MDELEMLVVTNFRCIVCRQSADNRQCADTFFIRALNKASICDNVPTIFIAVNARYAFLAALNSACISKSH